MKLKGTCRNTALKAFRLTHIFHEMAGFVFTFKLETQERQLTTFSFYYNYTGLFKLKKLIVFPYLPGILAWVDCFE